MFFGLLVNNVLNLCSKLIQPSFLLTTALELLSERSARLLISRVKY